MSALLRYEAVRSSLAALIKIDEVKDVVDRMAAIEAYGRQAKDRQLEADAVELRERAKRRMGELIVVEKSEGRLGRGRPIADEKCTTAEHLPRVTLEQLGIDRKLSSEVQKIAAVPESAFEARLGHMRSKVAEGRAPTDALRDHERESYRKNSRALATELSDKSEALKPGGRQFSVAYFDPAWRRKAGFGSRAYENHYPTMSWDDICSIPLAERLLPDAWGFCWIPRAHLLATTRMTVATPLGAVEIEVPLAYRVMKSLGFDSYSTCFIWTKTDDDHPDDVGSGLIVRDQDEILLLFKKGRGMPMPAAAEKFGSNHRERSKPLGHSRKPEFYRHMIRTMVGEGVPVLELFARVDDEHPLPKDFYAWGNQAGLPEASLDADDQLVDVNEVIDLPRFLPLRNGQEAAA